MDMSMTATNVENAQRWRGISWIFTKLIEQIDQIFRLNAREKIMRRLQSRSLDVNTASPSAN